MILIMIRDNKKNHKSILHLKMIKVIKKIKMQFYLQKAISQQIPFQKLKFPILGILSQEKRKMFLMTVVHQRKVNKGMNFRIINKNNKVKLRISLWMGKNQLKMVRKRYNFINLRNNLICFLGKKNKKL